MYFRILRDVDTGAVSYLIADMDAGECVLVDPRVKDAPLLAALLAEHALQLRWVLRTHQHDADGAAAVEALRALGAPVVQGGAAVGAEVPPDGEVLAVRPRSIGIADMGDHFVISFMDAPMKPANDAMQAWALALRNR